MRNFLTVAWATPVEVTELGPRVESYVDNKARITALRLCVKHAPTDSSLAELPQEIIEMIATHLRQATFEVRQPQWIHSMTCCLGECNPEDHLDKAIVEAAKREWLEDEDFPPLLDNEMEDGAFVGRLLDEYCNEIYPIHEACVDAFLKIIGERSSTAMARFDFAKYMKVFATDFHLEVQFHVREEYTGDDRFYYEWIHNVYAYLLLPSHYSNMEISPGVGMVSFYGSMIINPLATQEPSSEQKARFRTAMVMLKLEPMVHPLQVTPTHSTSTSFILPQPQIRILSGFEAKAFKASPATTVEATELAASTWPKLMALGAGMGYAEDDY